MASPMLFTSDEELSDVQVLDSNEPLVTASSSRRSARVRDSYEPLVPTVIVKVFEWDSDEPLVSASSSVSARVLDSTEPLATAYSGSARVLDSLEPLVPTGPSSLLESEEPLATPGARATASGNPPVAVAAAAAAAAAASSSSEDDEEYVPAVPAMATVANPTGATGRRVHAYSDELRSMWNWRRIFTKLGTNAQCIQFAEERGLLPTTRMCSIHKQPMSLTATAGQVGKFRCRKSTCRSTSVSRALGTWFENARLTLTMIFQIMYAFSEGLSYHQTRKELSDEACPVVSMRTVADWFNYCRETIAIYELENQKAQGKIGGPNKIVQIDESKFGTRKYNRGRQIEGHWVIGMIEDGSDDLRLEVCPDNERSADILVPLIKKHVAEGSIIHTDFWKAYLSLPQHGYIHRRVNHSDPQNKFVAPDGTHTQRIESQWRGLKKQFRQKQNKHDFTDWLCEYAWRRRLMINHLDPYEELIKAIKYVYKIDP